MVSITNVSNPGSARLDGSSKELPARENLKDGRQALALPPETRENTSSKVEYRASTSESLQYRGYKVFKRAVYANETLKLFQPKFKTSQPDPAAAPVKSDSAAYLGNKQSPVQTATNILGFIEQRLTQRQAEGASEADLDSLLQQAREGIDKGFEQARADLEKLGLMTEDLSGEIDQSYDLALNGLETLKVKFGLAEPAPQTAPDSNQAAPVANTAEPTKISAPVSDAKTQVDVSPSRTLESSRLSYQSGMRGSLMITTRDGDKVYLDETLIESLRYKSVTRTDGSYERFSAASQYTQELRIQGSLDEDEMSAIQDLVDKASEIAGLMQTDDFQAALEQAMTLEFDTSEIASFALQLTRVEVFTTKSVVYKKPTPMPAFAPVLSQLDRKISEVVSLLDQLKISNSEFAEFIAQRVPVHHQQPESASKQVQSFQAITEQLLNLHRGVDRDSFKAL